LRGHRDSLATEITEFTEEATEKSFFSPLPYLCDLCVLCGKPLRALTANRCNNTENLDMKSINKAILIGHAGKQPEVRYTQGGAPVANFSLATNEYWTSNTGERGERTEWHKIVAWGKLAEFCQEYVHKGSYLYVEGRIQSRSYDDRDGIKRYITEIRALEIGLLDRKPGGGIETVGGEPPIDTIPPETSGGGGGDDEVPF